MKTVENITFKSLTTFRVGGKIKYYVEVKDVNDIGEAVKFSKDRGLPIFILGGGSDFLAGEKEFNGLVIKYIGDSCHIDGKYVTAEAGMEWDRLVKVTVENGLQGLECLSGIPGTVGASPIQNIGAYGAEISNTFYKLEAYNLDDNSIVTFDKDDCEFGYRESIFKRPDYWQKYLIMNVTFELNKNTKGMISYESLKGVVPENASIKEIREGVLKIRSEKLENPAEHGNAGSFFKNPVISGSQKEKLIKDFPEAKIYPFKEDFKVSAAWLIEKAGLKGKEMGGAAVSSKHSLILINKTGNAKAKEICDLSEFIISEVYKKYGIKLEREVQLINF